METFTINEVMRKADNPARTMIQSTGSSGATVFIPHYYHAETDTWFGFTKSVHTIDNNIHFATRNGSSDGWHKMEELIKILPFNHKVRKRLYAKMCELGEDNIEGIV